MPDIPLNKSASDNIDLGKSLIDKSDLIISNEYSYNYNYSRMILTVICISH